MPGSVRADAGVALEGMVALHERDGRGWKAEWSVLPEACQLTGAALGFAARLLGGLTVDADRMRANLDSHGAAMTSEPLMAALAARIGKHSAHDAVYAAAMAARDEGVDLGGRLVADGLLDAEEGRTAACDPARALGAATAFVDRVLRGPGLSHRGCCWTDRGPGCAGPSRRRCSPRPGSPRRPGSRSGSSATT